MRSSWKDSIFLRKCFFTAVYPVKMSSYFCLFFWLLVNFGCWCVVIFSLSERTLFVCRPQFIVWLNLAGNVHEFQSSTKKNVFVAQRKFWVLIRIFVQFRLKCGWMRNMRWWNQNAINSDVVPSVFYLFLSLSLVFNVLESFNAFIQSNWQMSRFRWHLGHIEITSLTWLFVNDHNFERKKWRKCTVLSTNTRAWFDMKGINE